MNNGGVNILENILADSFGVYKMNQNIKIKNDNRDRYKDNNNIPPGSEDQMNENELDA